MTSLILAVSITLLATDAAERVSMVRPQECVGSPTSPSLDHVVLAVRDLDAATASFMSHGFRVKQGRLHANGLLNRHVKFRDGSSVELMTVRGEPGDAMARDYADLLADGEGGVYVALSVRSLGSVDTAAGRAQLTILRSGSGPWRFISFPRSSPAAAMFFSSGGVGAQDPDSLLSHRPDAIGLGEAWLEGGPELGVLLVHLGAKRCGRARAHDGRIGERFGLSRGSLVVVPHVRGVRPRVPGVVLRTSRPVGEVVRPYAGFWISYSADMP